MSVLKFIDAYKQSPPYQRQQGMLAAPTEINSEAPDPLVRATSWTKVERGNMGRVGQYWERKFLTSRPLQCCVHTTAKA